MDVSVVLLEYYSLDDVKQFIKSLKPKMEGLTYEIIVSSNSAYDDEKIIAIRAEFPELNWVFNQKNLGFAKGVNRGVQHATGRAVLISNVDVTLLTPLRDTYDFLVTHPLIGLIGPQIRDERGELQDSCRRFMTPMFLLKRLFQRLIHKKIVLLYRDFNYDIRQPVDWVIGAFMLIRKEVFEKIGLLDEKYFMYVEDMDFCKSLWENGLEVYFDPSCKVQYKGDRKSLRPFFNQRGGVRYCWYHVLSFLRFFIKYKGNIKRPERNEVG